MMKKFILFGYLLSFIWLSSCKDDENPIDPIPQEIEVEILGLNEGDVVWNEVSLSFENKTDVEIQKIEVYINNQLETTLEETPFKHAWQTSSLEDGEYNIKAIAFDAIGNKTEIQLKVMVKNTLLTLKVEEEYLENDGSFGERGFIIISDKDGKTVFVEEYFNGSVITIKKPLNFASGEFMLTNFTEQNYLYQNKPIVYLETYFLNEIEEWNLKPSEEEQDNATGIEIGEASLNFVNYSEYESIFMSDFYTSRTIYDLAAEEPFSLYQPSTDIFLLMHGTQDNKFKIVKGLKDGEEREIDLSVTEKNTTKIVSNPYHGRFTSFSWDLEGYYNDDINKSVSLYSDYTTSENVEFIYPEGIFQKFKTNFWGYNDQFEYHTTIIGEIPDAVELIEVDYTLESSEIDNFKVSITGDWDFYSAMWSNGDHEGTAVFIDWAVIAGKDHLAIALPELPSEIQEIYPEIDLSTLQFDEIAIVDADEIDGYEGYIATASQGGFEREKGAYKIAWFDRFQKAENNGRNKYSPKSLKTRSLFNNSKK